MDLSRDFRRNFASRVATLLGVSLVTPFAFVGCGAKVVVDAEGAGGAGGSGTTTGTTATGVGGSSGTSGTVGASSSSGGPTCAGGSGELTSYLSCFQPGAGGCPAAGDAYGDVAASLDSCSCLYSVDTGPKPDPSGNGYCCYDVTVEIVCIPGRALRGDEGPVVAPFEAARRGWSEASIAPDLAGLSPEVREVLAARWIRDGLFEHASVASFSRLSLSLLANGAGEELVRAAHEAALDEVRHARLSLSLAAAYRGAPVAPQALAGATSLPMEEGLGALAVSTMIEGAIGETMAAVLAAEQAERASDPAVRRVLQGIAEDEARHAELAFRVIAFAIAAGGEAVREAVWGAMGEARGYLPVPPPEPAIQAAIAEAHGHVPPAVAREAFVRAMDEVVLPLVRALSSAPAPSALA